MKRFILGMLALVVMLNFSGCSGSGDAMKFSDENVKEFSQELNDASESIDLNMTQSERLKILIKEPLNDMGYSLDATLLEFIKLKSTHITGYHPLGSAEVFLQIFDPLTEFAINNPKLVVDKDILEEDTVEKLKKYYKYRNLNKKSIQVINYVEECQKSNNGDCTIKQFVTILFNNNFVKKDAKLTAQNFWDSKNDTAKFQFQSNLTSGLGSIEKYVVWKNGSKINTNFMFDDKNKKLKLSDNALKDLEEYNPWWKE